MFRARLPSIFITSHTMPHLPRNLHLVAARRSPDNAIRKSTQHGMSKVLRLPRKSENCNSSCENVAKALRLPHKTISDALEDTSEIHEATPANRNKATRRLKPPKMTPFCRTYRTARWPSRGRLRRRLRRRLRTVANINATSSERTLNPQTPRVKREPLLRIREMKHFLQDAGARQTNKKAELLQKNYTTG